MRILKMSFMRNTRNAEILPADRQVKAGYYVRHKDMKAWLLSWGTDRELPPPKCVCGKDHDGHLRKQFGSWKWES